MKGPSWRTFLHSLQTWAPWSSFLLTLLENLPAQPPDSALLEELPDEHLPDLANLKQFPVEPPEGAIMENLPAQLPDSAPLEQLLAQPPEGALLENLPAQPPYSALLEELPYEHLTDSALFEEPPATAVAPPQEGRTPRRHSYSGDQRFRRR